MGGVKCDTLSFNINFHTFQHLQKIHVHNSTVHTNVPFRNRPYNTSRIPSLRTNFTTLIFMFTKTVLMWMLYSPRTDRVCIMHRMYHRVLYMQSQTSDLHQGIFTYWHVRIRPTQKGCVRKSDVVWQRGVHNWRCRCISAPIRILLSSSTTTERLTINLCGHSTQPGENSPPCSGWCVCWSFWWGDETVVVGHVGVMDSSGWSLRVDWGQMQKKEHKSVW